MFLELSLISALFIFMLDYGLGHPADEKPGYGSMLFFISFWHAKRALGPVYSNLLVQYKGQIKTAKNKLEKHQIKRSFQEVVFTQGRQLFTWQKAVGMCPYCTHFWFTVILFFSGSIFYKENIITFTLYFLLSHLLIRIFKKWI